MRQADKKPKILVIVGPTASGKSGLAVELAKLFNGEVISADSRQVYRGLDIGTAKITKAEMANVPHHLIDIADPNDVYTAADFARDAKAAVSDINHRGKLPIVAGGTFFYVDALLGRVNFPEVEPNPELRAKLDEKSAAELFRELEQKDPRRAIDIDKNNKRRLVRALEITHSFEYVPRAKILPSPYSYLTLGLLTEKEDLREKFAKRASDWLSRSFLDEIARLLAESVNRERLQEIGFEYRLGLELMDGAVNEAEFVQKFIEKNWQYAKRQLTWLKRYDDIKWFVVGDMKLEESVREFLGG